MAGTEAIINKILADAKSKADSIVADAKSQSDKLINDTKKQCKDYEKANLDQKDAIVNGVLERGKTVSDLDVKKIVLKAKKDAIDKAFEMAGSNLKGLAKADYKKLVKGMILSCCEDGDVVTIAKTDKGTISKAFIDGIAKEKKIKLLINKTYGDFKGGVILTGGGMDKNLTLDVELKVLREELETEVANMIFVKEN